MMCTLLATPLGVIAGLDPAIHPPAGWSRFAIGMDARVEPAHDAPRAWSALPL
ncbi:MAG: hypothetical protein HXX10_27230 [Rhodoplanes sp.]|uniref:hypothetical protein n=1 Tax=Rhodoplanes sp. TaxID=1968906 RepID=UPI0017CCBFC3|nr:hypothetical protein [Rhodoplanes sp.]NVO17734.1 hypothetical protein [Rhodoplanes sp.]